MRAAFAVAKAYAAASPVSVSLSHNVLIDFKHSRTSFCAWLWHMPAAYDPVFVYDAKGEIDIPSRQAELIVTDPFWLGCYLANVVSILGDGESVATLVEDRIGYAYLEQHD